MFGLAGATKQSSARRDFVEKLFEQAMQLKRRPLAAVRQQRHGGIGRAIDAPAGDCRRGFAPRPDRTALASRASRTVPAVPANGCKQLPAASWTVWRGLQSSGDERDRLGRLLQ
jgi:hypothetical protein